jgi:hypothetical protein
MEIEDESWFIIVPSFSAVPWRGPAASNTSRRRDMISELQVIEANIGLDM